jgi:Bacterial dnaA protein helix-turn-helix
MFAPNPSRLQLAPRIALAIIDATVSAHLGTTRVTGNAQPAVFNRQLAMYLAKHVGGWSTTRIGKYYNGRDHSTVCYALKRIAALREADPQVDALLINLTNEIRSAAPSGARHHNVSDANPRVGRSPSDCNEEFLDALADRIVERLRLRGVAASD